MFKLAPETGEDAGQVEYLFDVVFGPGRTSLSSYRLREGVDPVRDLCLVARDASGFLTGAIRYWPIAVGGADAGNVLLGPVAVHPTCQGEGLGSLLIRDSPARAAHRGVRSVVLVGDAPYYGRFGFRKAGLLDFPPPANPERVLALGLVDGAFDALVGPVTSVRRQGRGASVPPFSSLRRSSR